MLGSPLQANNQRTHIALAMSDCTREDAEVCISKPLYGLRLKFGVSRFRHSGIASNGGLH